MKKSVFQISLALTTLLSGSSAAMASEGDQYEVATFDDLSLDPESYWRGDTEDPDYMTGSFKSGSFEFNNYYYADWDFWAFFGYSNRTSTSYASMNDQYNSAVGSGHNGSANYGVAYVSSWMGITQVTLPEATDDGLTIKGFWVTNTAWAVKAILEGDGMSDKFAQGDYFKIIVTGKKADETTATIEYYLADYRAEDPADHYYLDTWQWVDLSELGDVTSLTFDMASTKSNDYGITTPTYFCLDDFGADREVADAQLLTVTADDETLDLTGYFSFDPATATVTYALEADPENASLSGSTVEFNAPDNSEFEMIAHATQRGRHEYVRIPVKIDFSNAGIDDATYTDIRIYPNPASDYLTISTSADNYSFELVNLSGVTVRSIANCAGTTTVAVDDLPSGIYLLGITAGNGNRTIHKVIVTE